jgi:glycerol kinase
VNIAGTTLFEPALDEKKRQGMLRGWARAVERAKKWHEIEEEDAEEAEFEKQL